MWRLRHKMGSDMIIGIGSDLADIRRIEGTLARFGERFTNRVFTEIEQAKSDKRRERAGLLRQTLGGEGGVFQGARHRAFHGDCKWREMGVVNLPSGQPTMALTGGAAERLARVD